jgi:hypothetical protein
MPVWAHGDYSVSEKSEKSTVESKSNEELVRLYERAAHDHRQATDAEAGNKAAHLVALIYRELRKRGLAAQSLLLPLLDAPDFGVRGWAGAHALEFAPEKGEPVLEALSNEPRSLGFSARMTLKVWREGTLKFS